MRISIIGVGLIGGSLALTLRHKVALERVYGVDFSVRNLEIAVSKGIIDEAVTMQFAATNSDILFVAVPVDSTLNIVIELLDKIPDHAIVVDLGSTKQAVCEAVQKHPKRGRYVATHPMWGTEFSGPEAAVGNAFAGRACVICDKQFSDLDAQQKVEMVIENLGMHKIEMDAASHDMHAAYISHISHITSFALANTVLEKEKEEDAIFEMAGGGFESTVRLAKSNADMWLPIFRQNKENVLDVLNEHIAQLRKFKASLEKENWEYLNELMVNANKIKRIINK